MGRVVGVRRQRDDERRPVGGGPSRSSFAGAAGRATRGARRRRGHGRQGRVAGRAAAGGGVVGAARVAGVGSGRGGMPERAGCAASAGPTRPRRTRCGGLREHSRVVAGQRLGPAGRRGGGDRRGGGAGRGGVGTSTDRRAAGSPGGHGAGLGASDAGAGQVLRLGFTELLVAVDPDPVVPDPDGSALTEAVAVIAAAAAATARRWGAAVSGLSAWELAAAVTSGGLLTRPAWWCRSTRAVPGEVITRPEPSRGRSSTVCREAVGDSDRRRHPAAGRAGPAGRAVPLRADPGGDRPGAVDPGAGPAGAGGRRARAHRPVRAPVRVSRHTLDRWIRDWRRGGFDALVPAPGASHAAHPGRGAGGGGGAETGEPGPHRRPGRAGSCAPSPGGRPRSGPCNATSSGWRCSTARRRRRSPARRRRRCSAGSRPIGPTSCGSVTPCTARTSAAARRICSRSSTTIPGR